MPVSCLAQDTSELFVFLFVLPDPPYLFILRPMPPYAHSFLLCPSPSVSPHHDSLPAFLFFLSLHVSSDFLSSFTLLHHLYSQPPAVHYHKHEAAVGSGTTPPNPTHPALSPDPSLKHLDVSSVTTKTSQTCHRILKQLPKPWHFTLYFTKSGCPIVSRRSRFCFSPLFLYSFASPSQSVGSDVRRIVSYLISPSAPGHIVPRRRGRREVGQF